MLALTVNSDVHRLLQNFRSFCNFAVEGGWYAIVNQTLIHFFQRSNYSRIGTAGKVNEREEAGFGNGIASRADNIFYCR